MLSATARATRVFVLVSVVVLVSAATVGGRPAPAGASNARGGPTLGNALAPAKGVVAGASAAVSGSAAYRHGLLPIIGAAPGHTPAVAVARSQSAAGGNLVFGGGNAGVGVASGAPQVYLVFWGSAWGKESPNAQGDLTFAADSMSMAPELQAFMKGLGAGSESWSGVMTQYCEGVPAGAQSCPADAAHVGYPTGGALAGVWADSATTVDRYTTPHELAAEAVRAADHFGNTTQASNRNTQYFVVSPPYANPDGFNVGGGFCAWHDFSGDPALKGGAVASPFAVAFTNMPYVTDAGTGCGAGFVNSGFLGATDGVTIVAGHEYAETITDPFPNGGWQDSAGFENGDKCAWIRSGSGQGASQNITLTTGTFAVQSTWANDYDRGNGGCEVSHSIVGATAAMAPAITSYYDVTFSVDTPVTFTVSTTGFPVPAISETGSLPAGVSFTDNHDGNATLAGAPAKGTDGRYALRLTAANGVATSAVQTFVLTVNRNLAIINFAGVPAGASGNTGDGAPATLATVYQPRGVAVDTAGNVYMVDSGNRRIRKIDSSGTITNFAGSPTGAMGNTGDGGPATAAVLISPIAVAVDSAGNVYIADAGTNRVRKVDTDGTITNFAGSATAVSGNAGDGGLAVSATLHVPAGLAIDAARNVYISDAGNNRVRKVDAAGVITNFAGSPTGAWGNTGDGGPATSATMNGPGGLAADRAGNVFIAAVLNQRVRKVDTGGTITNFAGSPDGTYGIAGNTGDDGPAALAALNQPNMLALDSVGNTYIADAGNNRVRKVDKAGIITNIAGDPAGSDSGSGNAGDGGPATWATLDYPTGLTVDPAGNVYLSDYYNHNRVRKVPAATPPPISSGATTTFTVGVAGSFTVTTVGLPAPTISQTGPLPSGVTFDGGARRLSGTPAQGTAGAYAIAFRAANGAGAVSQYFTLTVNQAPALTTAAAATFTEGAAGSFPVIAAGSPAPTVTEIGALPAGMWFDNGNYILGGRPALGTAGVYPIAFHAANGVGTAASQNFTLTINQAPPVAPAITSAPAATFTVGAPGRFQVTAAGWPPPTVTETGTLPAGMYFDNANLALFGLPAPATGGVYPITFAAVNGIGSGATQNFTLTVTQPAAITSAASVTFTVGVPGSFPVTTSGSPAAIVAEGGTLPAGVTYNEATKTLSGTPAQGTVGTYPITLHAANSIASADQSFTLTVNQATFTTPVDGQSNVDTTQPFAWSAIPEAQGYYFIVGTTTFGADLVNSGVLPPGTASFPVPALPAGPALHATLLAEVNGAWTSYQAISFTAAPGLATFTYPLNGQADVDPTDPFTWATIAQAQGYVVVAGTTPNGTNVFNSGVLPATASSFTPPLLPSRQVLFATLLTKVNGAFTRSQSIVIIAKPPTATLTHPVDGQANVSTPSTFTWTTIAGAQNYYLVVGTTPNGTDLVNSGLIPPTAAGFAVPKLPSNKLLYATLLTEVNGNWTSQLVVFIAT